MRGKVWTALGAVAALVAAAGLFVWSRQADTEGVAAALFDVYLPTRLAFVADADAPRLVGLDVESGAQTRLDVRGKVRFMAVDKVRGVLAYAADDEDAVFLRHLSSHVEQRVALPHAVRGLAVEAGSGEVWVLGADALSVVDARGGVRAVLSGVAGVRSVHRHPFAEEVVVLAEGAVLRLSLTGARLQTYALPAGWSELTQAALSPDGAFLLFGAYDGGTGQYVAAVLRMEDGAWRSFAMSAPLLRPLADNGARWLFFVDTAGQGLRVDAEDWAQSRVFTVPAGARRMALGWLDAHLLVAGEDGARLLDAQSLAVRHEVALPGAVEEVFVTADSKSALLSVRGRGEVFVVDLRGGAVRALPLADGVRPLGIVMGATYALCH